MSLQNEQTFPYSSFSSSYDLSETARVNFFIFAAILRIYCFNVLIFLIKFFIHSEISQQLIVLSFQINEAKEVDILFREHRPKIFDFLNRFWPLTSVPPSFSLFSGHHQLK